MKRHRCIVCNRPFPHGQGIVIEYGGKKLEFHSNKCASKFFRMLLERVPPDTLEGYIGRLIEELREKHRMEDRLKAKKI